MDISRYPALAQIQRQIAALNACGSYFALERQHEKILRLIDTARCNQQIQPPSYFSLICLAKGSYSRRRAELNQVKGGLNAKSPF